MNKQFSMERRGGGKGRKSHHTKGRQLDEQALADVEGLLGNAARSRDLLIEHLHKIQDHFGCLEAKHMRALAETMKLSMAEVYEVASFYDHFDIVFEAEVTNCIFILPMFSISMQFFT